MTDHLTTLESEITAAGHELEREYVFGELDTRDGDGWRITVDGAVVAAGASIGAAEKRLRDWWNSNKEPGMSEHPEGYTSSASIGEAAKAIEDGGHEVTVRSDDEGIWSAVVDGKSISWTRSLVQLEADLRRWWEENRV